MPNTTDNFDIPFLDGTELVRDYPQFSEDLADAVDAGLSSGFRIVDTLYFESSGQFVKADFPFLRAIRVKCQGGGGGGGGLQGTANLFAAGGNAGGFAEAFITDIAGLNATMTVTRGGGGAGGVGNTTGASGGSSEFGSSGTGFLTRAGGGGGGLGNGGFTSATVGAGLVGDLLITGGFAEPGNGARDRGGSGSGGSSQMSGKSRAIPDSGAGSPGQPGLTFGGGGGGARSGSGTGSQTGGAGGNGIVIIELFA